MRDAILVAVKLHYLDEVDDDQKTAWVVESALWMLDAARKAEAFG